MKKLLILAGIATLLSSVRAEEVKKVSVAETMVFIKSKVDDQTLMMAGLGDLTNEKFGFSFSEKNPCDVEEKISLDGEMTNLGTGKTDPIHDRVSRHFRLQDVDMGGINIKFEGKSSGSYTREYYELILPSTSNKKFPLIEQTLSDEGTVEKESFHENPLIRFPFSEEIDAERVKRAFEYAIPKCGGKSYPF